MRQLQPVQQYKQTLHEGCGRRFGLEMSRTRLRNHPIWRHATRTRKYGVSCISRTKLAIGLRGGRGILQLNSSTYGCGRARRNIFDLVPADFRSWRKHTLASSRYAGEDRKGMQFSKSRGAVETIESRLVDPYGDFGESLVKAVLPRSGWTHNHHEIIRRIHMIIKQSFMASQMEVEDYFIRKLHGMAVTPI